MIGQAAVLEGFTLAERGAQQDLATFLGRARRLDEEGAVRLTAEGDVLVVTVAVLYPQGLGDEMPWALGMRMFRLAAAMPPSGDVTVPLAGMTDRLARLQKLGATGTDSIGVPPQRSFVVWAGLTPPRTAWEPDGSIDGRELLDRASAGIEEIRAAVPEVLGRPLAAKARSRVWSRRLPQGIPAGAAFALSGLGFLPDAEEAVRVFRNGPWQRLSTRRGHVLSRSESF